MKNEVPSKLLTHWEKNVSSSEGEKKHAFDNYLGQSRKVEVQVGIWEAHICLTC